MTAELRILIVGGYGIFGGRLVELLEDDARLTLLVAGRSLDSAQAYCAGRSQARARLAPTVFDRATVAPAALADLRLTALVDASGPFQAYGEQRYRLVEHCIACGVHYLDLADGSDFVAGIGQFDAAARAAGVFVLSGVSSFPVLTAAVVRRLAVGMREVRSIQGGIAPSPYAGVGLNVIRAIASYAGKPIALQRQGRTQMGWPFAESMRFVIAVPGHVPLRRTLFSLVDVPDLRTLPTLWPQLMQVWMGAGPVPAPLHWSLIALAWLVRLRLLRGLSWLAGAMHFVTNRVRWGAHRGGMFVVVRGRDEAGSPLLREWHLLAEGDDGPLIPSMAVEAVIRNMLAGSTPAPGARAASVDIELADYESLFARRTIYTGIRQRLPPLAEPLFRRALGPVWEQLPEPVQRLHSVSVRSTFAGNCDVRRGTNPLARLAAALFGFPAAGTGQTIAVDITVAAGRERWVRTIGGRSFSSVLTPGRGRSEWLVRERFGPVAANIALISNAGCLQYIIRSWTLFGIPLPLWLGPRSTATESAPHGKFHFDVAISHPLTGLIVRYQGVLAARG
jgi:Domain of unknown function (DUF4166)/Saccharopine dehydrogenase NADP binding domain